LTYEPTRHRRSCFGFIVAATVGTAAFILGLWAFGLPNENLPAVLIAGLSISALLIAGPATVLLGVPLYLVLRGRIRATITNCCLLGALVGAVTMAIWSAILEAGLGALWLIGAGLLCGSAGGLAFWLVSAREINRDF
jgi:putative effector of murein hydrolase